MTDKEINEKILQLTKKRAYQELSSLYLQMALTLHEDGHDPMPLLTQSKKFELLEYKKDSDFIKKVKILTAGDQSCKHCKALNNKEFTIEEALNLMPLPCKACTTWKEDTGYGWCRCGYSPIVKDKLF